jgi:hypothetical protein
MTKFVRLFAATTTLCLAATGSYALPFNTGGDLRPALDATDVTQKAAVYVVEGRPYCFYFRGWHGPGWYRCGFAWRHGLGWGGVYGWQGWEYGPAARRFGSGGVTIREGREGYREGTSVHERARVRSGVTVREGREGYREGTSVHEGTKVRSSVRSGATVNKGSTVRSSESLRGETTGSGRSTGASSTISGRHNSTAPASGAASGRGSAGVKIESDHDKR